VVITTGVSDYGDHIKIEHLGVPTSQAAMILSGEPTIEVVGADGIEKFSKTFDLTNITIEADLTGTAGSNYIDSGNYETGSFATNNDTMIDGWREHSTEINADGFSYSYNVYTSEENLLNQTY